MQNDLTFFTSDPGSTLLDRFKKTLRDVKLFDILERYFRTGGFGRRHKPFASIDTLRVFVGLNVNHKTLELIDNCRIQTYQDFEKHKRTKEIFSNTSTAEMEDRWLSVDELGKHLCVGSDTLYRWIVRLGLPEHRIGRLWKFSVDKLDA